MKEKTTEPLRLCTRTHLHLKNEKGITLIAVAVSLVILIILALIGIRIAFNDDGVFRSAQKSGEVQSNSTMKDQELANTYVTEVENSELKLAVEQKEKSTPASNNQYTTGEEVKYEVTITNTGEKNLVDLELTDTLIRPDRTEGTPSGLPRGTTVIDRLEVNESKIVPITHTVEEKDLGGDLKNAVRVVGYAEDNPKESAEAESKVTVATVGSNENLEIAKEVISNPASPKGYMTGEEIIYKVTVKNKGKTTESNIIIDDEIKRLLQSGEEDPIEHWTFDTFYKVDTDEETNRLEPGESGYRIYSYTVQQKDLGKTLINNAKIRGKNKVPPGEKPVNPDKPSGTIEITKSVSTEGIIEGHEQEAKSHAYTFTLNVTKDGVPVTDTLYYTDENNTRKTIQSGGTFTLKDKQKITITGIPDGATYRITEEVYQIQNSGYYMESDKEEYTGTINLASSTEGLVTIECTNKEVPGLEIVKEVVSKPKYKKDAYMVGETVEYQIKITNIGRVNIAVTDIILDDVLKRQIEGTGQKDPIMNWTFNTLYEDKEEKTAIANTLKPGQVAYTKKYSYTIVSEDLGHTLINNVKIRKKLIPPGEKPVKPDVPTGTLNITKAYYEVEGIWTGAKFKITLRDKTGKELTEDKFPYYYGNVESGTITSGGTFALDNGEGYTIVGLPDGTKFTIQEIEAPSGFNLDPEIKEGTIDLSKSLAESVSFMNYQSAQLPSTGGGTTIGYSSERKISLTVGNPGGNNSDWKVSEEELLQLKEKLELRFYYIAEFTPEKPVYNILEKYKNIGILQKLSGSSSIDSTEWRAMAAAIEKYILENGIEADFTLRDRETIQDYRDGLYLILSDDIYTNQYIYSGIHMGISEWGDYRTSGLLITTYSKEYIEDGVYGDWMGPGLNMTSFGGGEIEKRQDGSLEIINTVQSCNTNSAAPFIYEVKGVIDGEIVYSNIVSIDITQAGQRSINILGEIPTGAEVTVKCIYSGVYQLMTETEQTVLVDNPDKKPSVNFTYEYNRDCKTITSATHSFIHDEEWQWSKDKEESIGYGIGDSTGVTATTTSENGYTNIKITDNDNREVAIALIDEYKHWTINNEIEAAADSDEVYIRVKSFAPEGIGLTYTSKSGEWQDGGDGYYYYSGILTGGSSTEAPLSVRLENINEDTANFNVAVIVEAVKVQYNEDGTPYADWNMKYNFDGEAGGE